MKNIFILLTLAALFSCGPSEEEKRKLTEKKEELEAKISFEKGVKDLYNKEFSSAEYSFKKIVNNYSKTSYLERAKAFVDSVKIEEKKFYLDPKTYEIVKTDPQGQCKNYHILIKFKDRSLENFNDFVKRFKAQFSSKGKICTITFYSSKSISHLMTKYPLSKSEYKQLAKNTIAGWDFDTKTITLNPYSDAFSQ